MIAAQTITFGELAYALGLIGFGYVAGLFAQFKHQQDRDRIRRMAAAEARRHYERNRR